MSAPREDFALDRDGLLEAIELLERHAGGEPLPARTLLNLPDDLPEAGVGGREALAWLAPPLLGGAAGLGHPGYLAHMDPPTPWMSWAGALWAAALSQNLLHPDSAPAARELEPLVVGWLAEPFGMLGGHLVPGSSMATLTALWAARELRGVERVVASGLSHLSVRKAAAILGLEYVAVGVDDAHRMRAGELAGVDLDRAALVLTAGTVAGGAIDPLDAGGEAAWRHVDAAWAGPLRLSPRHRHLLDGVEAADSVGVSAHKWLFQPKECGIVLFAEPDAAHEAISFGGGYLAAPNVGLLGSHGQTALPLAATLLAWGRSGVAALVEHCMAIAERLAELVDAHPELELWRSPTTGVVLWRPRRVPAQAVRDGLSGALVSLTTVGEETWLRSVAANPSADPQLVLDRVLAALPSP